MPFDISPQSIATYTNINDTPIEPTATKAGNGAHLIQQYNGLIELTKFNLEELDGRITQLATNPPTQFEKWIPITNNLNLPPSAKVFLNGTIAGGLDQTIIFAFQPGFNASVRVFNSSNCNIKIMLYGVFNGAPCESVYVDANTNKEVGFIWVNADTNWIATEPSLVRVVV